MPVSTPEPRRVNWLSMQSLVTVLALSLMALSPLKTARIAKVPDGSITGKTYQNSALDLSFRLQDGWTMAPIQMDAMQFAPDRASDDPVNKCSRALFSSEPPHPATLNPFRPRAIVFIFDPKCFPGPSFPRSTTDHAAVGAFARRIVHAFVHSPYIPPTGADFGGFDSGGRVFVTINAETNVASAEDSPAQGATVHVNTMLMLTESKGYWLVMAERVDDESKKIMQAGSVDISLRR
jgi:hypothetical protein